MCSKPGTSPDPPYPLPVQVHKFSKFIHGTATLLPDMVAAVPYWIDDESVRPSMVQSASNYSLPTAAAE